MHGRLCIQGAPLLPRRRPKARGRKAAGGQSGHGVDVPSRVAARRHDHHERSSPCQLQVPMFVRPRAQRVAACGPCGWERRAPCARPSRCDGVVREVSQSPCALTLPLTPTPTLTLLESFLVWPPHQAVRRWARPPCRHINIQSCCFLGSGSREADQPWP